MLDSFIQANTLLPWFYPTFFLIFGTMVGSFLNVCILRIPLGKSIVFPGSHCACGKPIAWHDNIPVLSWILLRGRARCCGGKFSVRYPAIELLTGLLFLACWLLFPLAQALCGMLLMSCLVCATFIDLDHMIIPDGLTLWLAVVGVILSLAFPALHGHDTGIYIVDSARSALDAILGVLIGSALVLWIALLAEAVLKKEAMGFGDVKFVGAIGAFTGWQGTITAIFGGAMVGTLWFCIAMVCKKLSGKTTTAVLKSENAEGEATELGMGAQVPYGPMLAIAGAAHYLLLHRWVNAYFAELSQLFGR
jgi:leader peptidase (prepilin peptidase)/N-methyltransferase